MTSVGIVILAAGSSRRLGRPKQLVRLDGRPLLQHAVDTAASVEPEELIVVVGHAADEVAEAIELPPGGRTVVNPDHETGQASSLRVGVLALGPQIDRAVVLLGDQPGIDPAVIRDVATGPGPIRRAVYRGQPGHPVAFDRECWNELMAINGDRGARDLLERDPGRVQLVEVDADPPGDVDTADDLRRLGLEG